MRGDSGQLSREEDKDRSCGVVEVPTLQPVRADSVDDDYQEEFNSDNECGSTTEDEYRRGDNESINKRRMEQAQPRERVVGHRRTRELSYIDENRSCFRNQHFHMGDVGIYLGSWGARSQKSGSKHSQVSP